MGRAASPRQPPGSAIPGAMGRLLVIDGGRSGCRAAVIGDAGREAEGEGRGLPTIAGPEGVAGVVQAVGETVALCSVNPETIDAVSAGLAGMLGASDHAPAVARGLARLLGVERVIVTGDVITAYAGALGAEPGVVVAAGTGAVALAVRGESSARSDGWGRLLGDAGSGYWIGARGLEQALRAYDGRGGSAALAGLAECHVGPLDALPQRVDASGNPAATVAAFARSVADAARRGDPVAAAIWQDAARELAVTAAACARKLFPAAEPVPVSWAGGLFAAADLLLEPFLAHLAALLPTAVPRPPAGDALSGAARLAASGGPGVLAPFVYDSAAPRAVPGSGVGAGPLRPAPALT